MIVRRLMVILSLTAVDWAERMIERILMWVGLSADAPGPSSGKDAASLHVERHHARKPHGDRHHRRGL
jgi:hypothetical protein